MSLVDRSGVAVRMDKYKNALKYKRNHQYPVALAKLANIFKQANSLGVDDVLMRCKCVLSMTKILRLSPHLMTKTEFMDKYVTPIIALLVYYSLYTHAIEIARRTGLNIYDRELYVYLSGSLIAAD